MDRPTFEKLAARIVEDAADAVLFTDREGIVRLWNAPYCRREKQSYRPIHRLYRSLGFQEIEPYAESEIPPEYWSRGAVTCTKPREERASAVAHRPGDWMPSSLVSRIWIAFSIISYPLRN